MRNKGGSGEIKETEDIKPQKFIAELEQNTHKGESNTPTEGESRTPTKGGEHKHPQRRGENGRRSPQTIGKRRRRVPPSHNPPLCKVVSSAFPGLSPRI